MSNGIVTVSFIDEYEDVHVITRKYSGPMLEGFMKAVAASQGASNPSYFFPIPNEDGTQWSHIRADRIVRIDVDVHDESDIMDSSHETKEE